VAQVLILADSLESAITRVKTHWLLPPITISDFYMLHGGYIPVHGHYIPVHGGYIPVHCGYIPRKIESF
jgi:hypothetical protein